MFESKMMFANVFVKSQVWIMVEGNRCGIGLMKMEWRHAGGSVDIRKTFC